MSFVKKRNPQSRLLRRSIAIRIRRSSALTASDAIAGRYQPRTARFSTPPQILRLLAVNSHNTFQSHHQHLQLAINITRRLSRVVNAMQMKTPVTAESFQSHILDRRLRTPAIRGNPDALPLRTLRPANTIGAVQEAKRVISRFNRQEAVRRKSTPTTPVFVDDTRSQSNTLTKLNPVPTVVVRRSTTAAEHSAPEITSANPARSTRAVTQHSFARESAPPIDVNRLTDEVIQTIDRRILSQRERLGRF